MATVPEVDIASALAEGQAALETGDKSRAAALFRAVIAADPLNEDAWLWLSGAVPPAEALVCLEQVLAINPGNEHAHEGLVWLQQTYGVSLSDSRLPSAEDPLPALPEAQFAPVRPHHHLVAVIRRLSDTQSELLEWGGHIAAIGALAGLLSLVIALRATNLLIMRGGRGALGWSATIAVVLTAALTHVLALGFGWSLLARRLAARRNDNPDDYRRSLVDAARALLPGYLLAPALVLALLGVGWSDRRWIPTTIVIAALTVLSVVLAARRILHLRVPLRITGHQARAHVALLLGPPAVTTGAGLLVAAALVRWLLRSL